MAQALVTEERDRPGRLQFSQPARCDLRLRVNFFLFSPLVSRGNFGRTTSTRSSTVILPLYFVYRECALNYQFYRLSAVATP